MEKVKGKTWVSLLTVSALAGSTVAMPSALALEAAPTTAPAEASTELAQGLVGQCRAAKRPIFIYSARNTGSQRIQVLGTNAAVTLADSGGGGWIAISAPVVGFVQTADLKMCVGQNPAPPTPAPTPPVSSLCRQVTVDINVRNNPNLNGRILRLLRAGQQVTLKTGQEVTASNGRLWTEITSPLNGWLSTRASTSSATNVKACAGSPPVATPPPSTSKSCTIAYPLGLRVWNSPTGSPIGGIAFNRGVTLTGERRVIGNRVWVKISSPMNAWISSGFVNSERNITCR